MGRRTGVVVSTNPQTLLDVILDVSGIPRELFLNSGKRTMWITSYRCVFSNILLEEGVRLTDIADLLGMDHTTVIYHRKRRDRVAYLMEQVLAELAVRKLTRLLPAPGRSFVDGSDAGGECDDRRALWDEAPGG